jgi:hypothetical protein
MLKIWGKFWVFWIWNECRNDHKSRSDDLHGVIKDSVMEIGWLWWAETVSQNCDTNGPIVHPTGDMWAWRTMVKMIPAGDKSWLIHRSSLAVLPAETSGASRRNGRSEDFAYQYLKYFKGSLTSRKILRHGTSGFTSHPKEGVLRIFMVLKNQSPRPVWTRDPWVKWQAQ